MSGEDHRSGNHDDVELAVSDTGAHVNGGYVKGNTERDSSSSAGDAGSTSHLADRWKQVAAVADKYAHFDPPSHGHGVKYRGPSGRFWTEIHHEKPDGSVAHWDARRHRRNLWPHRRRDDGTYDKLDSSNPFCLKVQHVKANKEAHRKLRFISFWPGPAFFVGSVLFMLGGAAGDAPGYFDEEWSDGLVDGLVNIPYFVGAVFYVVGAYAAALETANVNYRADMRAWVDGEYSAGGRKAAKPRIDWAPFPTHVQHDFLSYYGAQVQYLGAWIYVLGTAAQLAATHVGFSTAETYIWVITPYCAGGICFIVGAYLMAAEAAHSWWWGWLPPPPSQCRNVGRWVEFANVFGSFLFFVGGVLGYYEETATLLPWQVINTICFVFGAFVFLVQSMLLTLEWVFPQL